MTRSWKRNWAVLTAIVVHLGWALMMLFSDAPLSTTPLAEFPVKDRFWAAFVYGLASILAFLPVIWTKIDTKLTGLLLTLPQQYLLMISAFSGIYFSWQGHYPDGVQRGLWFILADQLWAIVGMVFHTCSIVDWYWFSRITVEQREEEK